MSEIEKLYKNAGVENYQLENFCGLVPKGYTTIDDEERKGYVKVVRDFTPEKQLSLIKWLANRKIYEQTDYLHLGIWSAFGEYAMGIGVEPFDDSLGFDLAVKGEKFEMCLARLINNLWQDLTEQERTEIADILRG